MYKHVPTLLLSSEDANYTCTVDSTAQLCICKLSYLIKSSNKSHSVRHQDPLQNRVFLPTQTHTYHRIFQVNKRCSFIPNHTILSQNVSWIFFFQILKVDSQAFICLQERSFQSVYRKSMHKVSNKHCICFKTKIQTKVWKSLYKLVPC